jgi:hypothetical protein
MWFWRGTQSAIFYYVSLSPCLEYNHKRKRRKEANRSQKERAELQILQPGLIHQPVPFQTNQYWAEEIEAGPGPPRGWRKHSLEDNAKRVGSGKKKGKDRKRSVFAPAPASQLTELSPPTTSSSDSTPQGAQIQSARPSLRASAIGAGSTLDALKDTLRSTIARPDTWNWKRYEREDETLFGINDRISRMWDRATNHGRQFSTERGQPSTPGRRRAGTADSDDHSWLYARNPGVNDLHPPTVSQLPRTKREVAWMMQPPPSRAVMEGKVRPGTESGTRRPLCRIEGIPVHPKSPDRYEERRQNKTPESVRNNRVPDILLSPGGTEHTEAVDEDDDGDGDDEEEAEDDEERTEVTSNQDYLSSISSSLQHPPSPSLLPKSPGTPRHASPLRRPPLAVLMDSTSPTRFQSYQLPVPSPKLATARSTSPPRPPELDVLLGVVLPTMPARSRYSLPNVRLGEY